MDLNKVMLLGRLCANPEMRTLPSGMPVANLRLAINRHWRDKQTNVVREEACFVDVESFGKQAELIRTYFTKGKPIFVEGRLRLDAWETKEGEKRSRIKVVLDRFQFVPDGRGPGQAEQVGQTSLMGQMSPPAEAADEEHDPAGAERSEQPVFAAVDPMSGRPPF